MEEQPIETGNQDNSPEIPWWKQDWYKEWEKLARHDKQGINPNPPLTYGETYNL